MFKATIFDLDGVLSDTDRTRFDLLKVLLKKRGLILTDDNYKKSVGKRTETFLKELFRQDLDDSEIRKIYQERKNELHRNPKKYVVPQPGAYACCKGLFEAGFTLAVASAAREIDIKLVLNELKVLAFFKVLVGSDLIKRMKPHPETYLKCLEELNLAKAECLAIEDSPTGIKSAKNAGLLCVAVVYTHAANELKEANKVIPSLNQLTPKFVSDMMN